MAFVETLEQGPADETPPRGWQLPPWASAVVAAGALAGIVVLGKASLEPAAVRLPIPGPGLVASEAQPTVTRLSPAGLVEVDFALVNAEAQPLQIRAVGPAAGARVSSALLGSTRGKLVGTVIGPRQSVQVRLSFTVTDCGRLAASSGHVLLKYADRNARLRTTEMSVPPEAGRTGRAGWNQLAVIADCAPDWQVRPMAGPPELSPQAPTAPRAAPG